MIDSDNAFDILSISSFSQFSEAVEGDDRKVSFIGRILNEYITIDYNNMLNYCLSNPYITTVDAGARYVQEFKQDIETSLLPRLSDEESKKLIQEADKVSGYMRGICRECMHCMEKFRCVKNINFPGILAVYSRYKICDNLGRDTDEFKRQYGKFELNATDCIECGKCVPWCEYKLDIPNMLKKAHEILGHEIIIKYLALYILDRIIYLKTLDCFIIISKEGVEEDELFT